MPRRVLFLADQFADSPRDASSRYPGGAELTDEAVILASPWPVERVRIRELREKDLDDFDLHLVGNLHQATTLQCRAIAERRRHVLFEHDYRMCRWRGNFTVSLSPTHRKLWRCNCRQSRWLETLASARGAVFLTHRQLAIYRGNPFVKLPRHAVLGCSVMGPEFFDAVKRFRAAGSPTGSGTCVLYSGHSAKGYKEALAHCADQGIDPFIIRNAAPAQVLSALTAAERLVFLPQWPEPASRVALEARFLGCDIVSNDALGVAGESWWHSEDSLAFDFVRSAADRFWSLVDSFSLGSSEPVYSWTRPNVSPDVCYQTPSTVRAIVAKRTANRVGIIHPSFTEIGGAERQAVAQARLMRDLGLLPEVYAFSWSARIWAGEFDSIAIRTLRTKEGSSSADLTWLEGELAGCKGIIAHNSPATLAVARLDHDAPKIWYCHEPPRWLHVETANPYLRENVGRAEGFRFSGFRHFMLHRYLPMNSSRAIHGMRERRRREDLKDAARFSVVWANSEFTRDLIRETYGALPVEVLYPAISPVGTTRRNSGLCRNPFRIMCTARLEPAKNVDALIWATAQLRGRGVPAELDVIGAGPSQRYLRALAWMLGLRSAVRFHGRVSDEKMGNIVAECDVFALIPFDEPFGMVFAEAMASGLIVVGPNHGGPREILDDARLGFMAEPLSIDSISEALERAYRLSDTDADRLRAAAAESSAARFSEAVIQARMRVLLKRVGVIQA